MILISTCSVRVFANVLDPEAEGRRGGGCGNQSKTLCTSPRYYFFAFLSKWFCQRIEPLENIVQHMPVVDIGTCVALKFPVSSTHSLSWGGWIQYPSTSLPLAWLTFQCSCFAASMVFRGGERFHLPCTITAGT